MGRMSTPSSATRSSSGGTYRRVASTEEASTKMQQDQQCRTRSRRERLTDKLHAFAWVIASFLIVKYTDFFQTILYDDNIFRPCLILAIIGMTVNLVLMLYLTVYLRNLQYPWEVYCPKVIPTMTAIGVSTYVLLVRATFPVWGFLSPFILGIVGLGCIFGMQFIPWF